MKKIHEVGSHKDEINEDSVSVIKEESDDTWKPFFVFQDSQIKPSVFAEVIKDKEKLFEKIIGFRKGRYFYQKGINKEGIREGVLVSCFHDKFRTEHPYFRKNTITDKDEWLKQTTEDISELNFDWYTW